MSEDKSNDKDDNELSKLLDSTLKDFGKTRTTDDEIDEMMMAHDQEAAKKAASDFQVMLQQMMTVQEEAMKAQSGAADEGLPSEVPEDARMFFSALEQLIERSGTVANAETTEEMVEGLEALRGPDSQLEPFIAMLMQTLASKEVMYPPLKEIHDGYPKYLEEHAEELDQATKERFEKQHEVLSRICEEFEKQGDIPGSTTGVASPSASTDFPVQDEHIDNDSSFEAIGKLLVGHIELQSLGYPPKELVGALPPGWSTDETGMPKVCSFLDNAIIESSYSKSQDLLKDFLNYILH